MTVLSTPTSVYVIDDDADVRRSLKWLLESAGLRVVCYASGRDFLESYQAGSPGCLLLDLRMPGLGGIELLMILTERRISLPTIILTGHGEVGLAVQAMKGGAFDFIEKPVGDEQLLDCVQQALRRDSQCRRLLAQRREIEDRVVRLTPRERQVMKLVVEGWSNKRLAVELGVSCKTIEAHRANLMRKMRASNVAELVRLSLAVVDDPH